MAFVAVVSVPLLGAAGAGVSNPVVDAVVRVFPNPVAFGASVLVSAVGVFRLKGADKTQKGNQ